MVAVMLFFGLRSSSRFHEVWWVPTVIGKYADWYMGTRKLLGYFAFSCATLCVLRNTRSRLVAAALLGFPVLIEILQALGGSRDGSASDAAIGAAGAAAALVVARWFSRMKRRPQGSEKREAPGKDENVE
jgi:VanZ family protein